MNTYEECAVRELAFVVPEDLLVPAAFLMVGSGPRVLFGLLGIACALVWQLLTHAKT